MNFSLRRLVLLLGLGLATLLTTALGSPITGAIDNSTVADPSFTVGCSKIWIGWTEIADYKFDPGSLSGQGRWEINAICRIDLSREALDDSNTKLSALSLRHVVEYDDHLGLVSVEGRWMTPQIARACRNCMLNYRDNSFTALQLGCECRDVWETIEIDPLVGVKDGLLWDVRGNYTGEQRERKRW